MNKVLMICLTGIILLTTGILRAQDSAKKGWDTRWFVSPLAKFQFQDFGMLEINRKGYLSDANKLAIQDRGNASFSASAYKNITGRLSISADIGLSFGHITNDQVLISQTKSKTYNLVNATFYYHLLSARYRLQPFVSAGINDIISDNSYASVPVGLGVKFNSKKIMIMGQAGYGYALGKNISNTLIYNVGFYLPIKNKKKKNSEAQDSSANKNGKDIKKDSTSKADSVAKNGAPATVVNNIYITINMDSVLKARGVLSDYDDQGENNIQWGGSSSSGGNRNRKGMNGNKAGQNGDMGREGKLRQAKRKGTKIEEHSGAADGNSGDSNATGLDSGSASPGQSDSSATAVNASGGRTGFDMEDSRVDTVDGKPVITFLVYFEFNEYSLTSRAFTTVDRIISRLRENPSLVVDVNGYTDDVGTVGQNNYISKHRAQMVFDYMNSRGVAKERMAAKFFGKEKPVADNDDPNLCWLNRRVEVLVREN
jgi:outer membrane protein OmpA-like peptidoglycan-associated protein